MKDFFQYLDNLNPNCIFIWFAIVAFLFIFIPTKKKNPVKKTENEYVKRMIESEKETTIF